MAARSDIPVVRSGRGKPRVLNSGSLAWNSAGVRCRRRAAFLAGTSRGSNTKANVGGARLHQAPLRCSVATVAGAEPSPLDRPVAASAASAKSLMSSCASFSRAAALLQRLKARERMRRGNLLVRVAGLLSYRQAIAPMAIARSACERQLRTVQLNAHYPQVFRIAIVVIAGEVHLHDAAVGGGRYRRGTPPNTADTRHQPRHPNRDQPRHPNRDQNRHLHRHQPRHPNRDQHRYRRRQRPVGQRRQRADFTH
jgi:hypothetical protein